MTVGKREFSCPDCGSIPSFSVVEYGTGLAIYQCSASTTHQPKESNVRRLSGTRCGALVDSEGQQRTSVLYRGADHGGQTVLQTLKARM